MGVPYLAWGMSARGGAPCAMTLVDVVDVSTHFVDDRRK